MSNSFQLNRNSAEIYSERYYILKHAHTQKKGSSYDVCNRVEKTCSIKIGERIFLKFTKLNFMFKIFKVAKHGLNLQMSKFSS